MIEDHPEFIQPPDHKLLWRYMDFTKFFSVLHTSSLYFARSDRMEDKFESALTEQNARQIHDFLHSSVVQTEDTNKLSDVFKGMYVKTQKDLYLSCWHMNEHESAAMWKLYCKSNEGIALCSTFKKMKYAFADTPDYLLASQVEYLDYKTEQFKVRNENGPIPNALVPILYKRKSFEHEQEVRIVWCKFLEANEPHAQCTGLEFGKSVHVDLSKLILRIMVSPTAGAWFKDIVYAALRLHNLPDIEVHQSSLYDTPLY